MLEAVVAVYPDWGIGCDGTQPVVLHADRKHFLEITAGATVMFGRKTMEDFPEGKPLPNRTNILLTRQSHPVEGAVLVHSIEEALAECAKYPKVYVIGGSSVYLQLFPHISKVFVTKINLATHSDSFFPDLDQLGNWHILSEGVLKKENGIPYQYLLYERSRT